jgi:hypothetical protein
MAIWQRIKGWLIVAALFVGGLFTAFYRGRRDGKEEQKQEQMVNDFQVHVEAEKKINEARQDVNSMSDDDLNKRTDDWMRD